MNLQDLKNIWIIIYYSLTTLQIAVSAVSDKTFPADFLFGAGTSSYQIEGGWDADGKGENIWDNFVHTYPEKIADQSTGDIACDSYHKYLEDVELIENLGLNFYRFSISWSRILPTGLITEINQAGIDYYRNLIDALKRINVEPFVVLYHWDLPQKLQETGGWPNPMLEEYFADYVRLVFQLFGDDVKLWGTFNEPAQICYAGYATGEKAPGHSLSGTADYLCIHTVIKAHARAYHIYDEEFRETQNGKISIILDGHWIMQDNSTTTNTNDTEIVDRAFQFLIGIFANPIYHPDGDYPKIIRDRVDNRSSLEGFISSRLPTFTTSEIEYIRGTYDFFGLNSYTTILVQRLDEYAIGTPSLLKDMGFVLSTNSEWNGSASSWLKVVPWGFRNLINWIYRNYAEPDILITENGYSDDGEELDDQDRITYHKEYLNSVLLAIHEDNINVIGYTAWSLLDNMEWAAGYTEQFGLYHVDFNDANRTRTIKNSALYYKQVIATKCLTEECPTGSSQAPYNFLMPCILIIFKFTINICLLNYFLSLIYQSTTTFPISIRKETEVQNLKGTWYIDQKFFKSIKITKS